MRTAVLPLLVCPACRSGGLEVQAFRSPVEGRIGDGVLFCEGCGGWYPVEDGLPDLLVGELAYTDDRRRFWQNWSSDLTELGLEPDPDWPVGSQDDLKLVQQEHFDWYAENATQSYEEYEGMPFWRAADRMAMKPWKAEVQPDATVLDVGCAQGRSTFPFLETGAEVVGFDISKRLVRQALDRARANHPGARFTFLAADGASLPFADGAFDHVLVYGVLHHLPDPRTTCHEVARVLGEGGTYFGSENNRTVLRGVFDALMRVLPIWHEEAGPQPLISAGDLREWFAGTGVELETRSSVFVPPHLVNLLGERLGGGLLRGVDAVLGRLGPLGRQGGLVLARGVKRGGDA